MLTTQEPCITIRPSTMDDAAACGRICFDAFDAINRAHGFPCDFATPEAAAEAITMPFSNPGFFCVVAEMEGRIVGSNCVDMRSVIAGVGPITVAPGVQNQHLGRRLMHAVLDHARERGSAGVRLVQAAFHNRSMSLYTSLGFHVREPLSCLQGRTAQRSVPGCPVRPAGPGDLEACDALCRQVHGFDRGGELAQAVRQGTALVVEREGRITGYASDLAIFGHTAAESNLDLQALIASADGFGGAGILVPTRNQALFRWCLAQGLRVVEPMTLMSTGLYSEPDGAWLPSIAF